MKDDLFHELTSDGKQVTVIPLYNVDMIACTKQLLVKTDYIFDPIHSIVRIEDIEIVVKKYEIAWNWVNYFWLLTVECDQIDRLKELLTYKVEK